MIPMPGRFFEVSRAWQAACWYAVITIVMTWPLAPNLTRDIPGDLGDPLLLCWAIAHAADHWLALLSGDLGAAVRFWHAGMFHPEPFITVYSDHFALHGLMILPVWVLTKNIILCYNLLFFASFVLGGTGMYLLTRELTGSARGAFVAGLMFMFTPYRFVTLVHLQVLSSQWMPLTLFGLRRYFTTGHKVALVGAGSALLFQNLSSGYFLLYFAPFVALYALAEMWSRGLLPQWRVWRDMVVTGLVTLALTLPFAFPYMLVQRQLQYKRPLAQVEAYSADVLAWFTATPKMNVWGWLQAWPKPEGLLFPGSVIVLMAIAGAVLVWRRPADLTADSRQYRSLRAIAIFGMVGAAVAVWMAMGPTPRWAGEPVPIPALYRLFYNYVPGFDVSRVPARFTTLMVLCLAVAAGYATAWLDRTGRRRLLLAVGVGVLLDGAALPLDRNLVFRTSGDVTAPEGRVYPVAQAPPLWSYLKTLPADVVIAHLPFGYPEYELRYLYYSQVDGHRMVNGYSGAFPLSYVTRQGAMQRLLAEPAAAIQSLRAGGVTHVVVHADAWPNDTGAQTLRVLERAGLTIESRVGESYVLQMPR